MMVNPANDCDSMCSISLTVVVMARSLGEAMRSAICSGERPLYIQTTVTTGISMFGKISVGIERMLKTPRIRIKSAKTTKVYGRRSASRTIHIGLLPAPESGWRFFVLSATDSPLVGRNYNTDKLRLRIEEIPACLNSGTDLTPRPDQYKPSRLPCYLMRQLNRINTGND